MASTEDRPHEGAFLDGNSVAGLLAECFRADLTTAWVVCAGCGAGATIGSLPAYGLPLGAVIRCKGCEGVVLRISQTRGRVWLDARGATSLRIDPAAWPTPR